VSHVLAGCDESVDQAHQQEYDCRPMTLQRCALFGGDVEDSGLEPLTSCLQVRVNGFSRYRHNAERPAKTRQTGANVRFLAQVLTRAEEGRIANSLKPLQETLWLVSLSETNGLNRINVTPQNQDSIGSIAI
jgi:hypothetical protein